MATKDKENTQTPVENQQIDKTEATNTEEVVTTEKTSSRN